MLQSLMIQNIALVDHAEINFCEGINILSGETGAGKSVILDSLDFVLGAKADKSMIRSGQDYCYVCAEFTCEGNEVRRILEDFQIEVDESIVIARKLTLEGKGGIKVNGCTVTASMLKQITSNLVDVHGQSEHFFLLKESNQLRLLDKITGEDAAGLKSILREEVKERRELIGQIFQLGGDDGERNRRLDILQFQIEEIERAAIQNGEEETLRALREKYANAEKILSGLNMVKEFLSADGGAEDSVKGAKRGFLQIEKYGDYDSLIVRLENVFEELSDIQGEAEKLASELNIDEAEFERVEDRLDEIKALQRKYGGSYEALQNFLSRAREEFSLLQNSEERLEELNCKVKQVENKIYENSLKLQEVRKKAALGFTSRVVDELRSLNIKSASFEIEFEDFTRADVEKATGEGMGGIKFLFSANAGEPLKELGKIISGGEMSRFMLAVKAQMSSMGEIGTYIFDEIDSGIGGKTAKVVAEKFCKIAKGTQIIAVSHLAQIAAVAERQFLIEKVERDGKTFTQVKELKDEERRLELARMISGETTEITLQQADEFLESAKVFKKSL